MVYKIKAIRTGLGIKQQDLANRLNISRQYLSKIEKNQTNPNNNIKKALAAALNSSIEELFLND